MMQHLAAFTALTRDQTSGECRCSHSHLCMLCGQLAAATSEVDQLQDDLQREKLDRQAAEKTLSDRIDECASADSRRRPSIGSCLTHLGCRTQFWRWTQSATDDDTSAEVATDGRHSCERANHLCWRAQDDG